MVLELINVTEEWSINPMKPKHKALLRWAKHIGLPLPTPYLTLIASRRKLKRLETK